MTRAIVIEPPIASDASASFALPPKAWSSPKRTKCVATATRHPNGAAKIDLRSASGIVRAAFAAAVPRNCRRASQTVKFREVSCPERSLQHHGLGESPLPSAGLPVSALHFAAESAEFDKPPIQKPGFAFFARGTNAT